MTILWKYWRQHEEINWFSAIESIGSGSFSTKTCFQKCGSLCAFVFCPTWPPCTWPDSHIDSQVQLSSQYCLNAHLWAFHIARPFQFQFLPLTPLLVCCVMKILLSQSFIKSYSSPMSDLPVSIPKLDGQHIRLRIGFTPTTRHLSCQE